MQKMVFIIIRNEGKEAVPVFYYDIGDDRGYWKVENRVFQEVNEAVVFAATSTDFVGGSIGGENQNQ